MNNALNQVPQSPAPLNAASYNAEILDSSSRVNMRLQRLYDRLTGSGIETSGGGKAPEPCGVLPMAASSLSNLVVAHKLLDDIEQLIG